MYMYGVARDARRVRRYAAIENRTSGSECVGSGGAGRASDPDARLLYLYL